MKNLKQLGFSHIIIFIAIVAVAFLGIIGFVLWQNPLLPDIGTTSTPFIPAETPAVEQSVSGFLVLEDWGVKFKTPTNLTNGNQITYQNKQNDFLGAHYEFSTTRVEAIGEGCALSGEASTSLGALTRLSSPSTAQGSAPLLLKKIGDYYYYYHHPQAACSYEEGKDIQISDVATIESMMLTIESI